ncbi:MAG: N-acetylmuramoyl-L-alanine amidase family protein [Akkermansiaceae bacterium]
MVFTLCAGAKQITWKTAQYKGVNYVPLAQVKTYYNFPSFTQSGSVLALKNADTTIEFRLGGQEVLMNNVKFIFSHPIVSIGGQNYVSQTDLIKIINPILLPTTIKTATPFNTVIIDPGHGGVDAGAVNHLGTEAYYNLKIARMLRDHLSKLGFKVVMTRQSDQFLTLQQRVKVANQYKNAIFISIHFNSIGGRARNQARGIETFTLSPVGVAHYGHTLKASDFRKRAGNAQDTANIGLATAIHWGTRMSLKKAGMTVPDRGIRRARFSVLTGVNHPAILFEGGFLSHPTESRLIHTRKYQETLAKAMCDSVVFYRKATIADRKNTVKR